MSKSMSVLQIMALEHARVIELPVPEPEQGEVLVKILAVVTCNQYDLHIYEGRPMLDPNQPVDFPQPPGFPGHEWVGEVVQVGPGVTELHLGDWVCMPGGKGRGRSYPGAYAQYKVLHESTAVRVPAGMEPLKLAPVEMGACLAANMLELKAMNAIEGKRVAVSGLGPAGLIGAQMLRAEGAAEVIGIEPNAKRREYALSIGVVDRVINPLSEDGKALPLRRGGSPAVIDVGLDCAGARASAQYLMDHTREIVSFFAVQREAYSFEGWWVGQHQGLKVFGTPDRHPGCGDYVVRKVKSGSIDLSLTVSHTLEMAEYGQAIQLIKSQQALKVAFFPNGPLT